MKKIILVFLMISFQNVSAYNKLTKLSDVVGDYQVNYAESNSVCEKIEHIVININNNHLMVTEFYNDGKVKYTRNKEYWNVNEGIAYSKPRFPIGKTYVKLFLQRQ